MRRAAVCTRDHVDDREPETGSPGRPRGVRATERLEGATHEALGEPPALVANVELDAAVASRHAEDDPAGAVTERVLDEVAERLLCAKPVDVELEVSVRLDLERPSGL